MIGAILQVPQLSQPDDGGRSGYTKAPADGIQRLLVPIEKSPFIVQKCSAPGKLPHSYFHLFLRHEERSPQDIGLPFIPIFLGLQIPEGIGLSCGIGFLPVAFHFIGFQLEQDLVSAFVGKGEPALAAQLLDLVRLDEAPIQHDLIFLKGVFPGCPIYFYGKVGVGIGSQAADTPICREGGEYHLQAQVVLGQLVDGGGERRL